jgi:hypothetical protein
MSFKKSKRKLNSSSSEIQSVAEQVDGIREYLEKKIKKKKLNELKKQLVIINKELKRNFTYEQINLFRDLKEQHASLTQEIDSIQSGKKLAEFENYIKTLDLGAFQTTNSEDRLIFKSDDDIDTFSPLTKLVTPSSSKTEAIAICTQSAEEADYVEVKSEDQLDNSSELFDSISILKYGAGAGAGAGAGMAPLINTHTYTPLRDADGAPPTSATKKKKKFTLKDDMPLRKINEINEKIVDYNLIAPKQADRDICPNCVKPLIHSEEEAILSCIECGIFRPHIDTSNNTAQSYYFTSRSANGGQKYNNQFDTILSYFDVENWVEIAETVYETIRKEVRMTEEPITISSLRIRDILRKYKLRQYYGNVVQIYSHLNGRITPVMTKEKKGSFQHAFKMLKIPYEKHKGDRKNFLSYALTFKKLCKHLSYEEFIPFLDIVKSTKSLRKQEKIWENMCVYELGWDYECDM